MRTIPCVEVPVEVSHNVVNFIFVIIAAGDTRENGWYWSILSKFAL